MNLVNRFLPVLWNAEEEMVFECGSNAAKRVSSAVKSRAESRP